MASDLAQSLAFAGIDEGTRLSLREAWPLIREGVPLMLAEMFAAVADDLVAVRDAQAEHWEALFRGDFDEAYAASLRQIGRTHAKFGLDPRFLFAAHMTTLTRLHALVVQTHYGEDLSFGGRSRLERAIRAVDQVVLLDLQLCLSAYIAELRGMVASDRPEDAAPNRATGPRRGRSDALFVASQRPRTAKTPPRT